jgi:hypothetical protein
VRDLRWSLHVDYSRIPPRELCYDRAVSPWEDNPITGELPREALRLRSAADKWYQNELARRARLRPAPRPLSRELVRRLRSLGYLR